MRIRVLFDKEARDEKFHIGWGVSFLIGEKVLFDTGEKSRWLLDNLKMANADPDKLESVVISHDHWDHRGGLWGLLKRRPKLVVYSCPNFRRSFKDRVKLYGGRLMQVDKFTRISDGIYTTGEIDARYRDRPMPEQALVIKTSKGLTVLTGCAHPGIIRIIENIKRNISGDIFLVMGGFHLIRKHKKTVRGVIGEFKRLKVGKVAPGHCSGKNVSELFKEAYGDDFMGLKVGAVFEV